MRLTAGPADLPPEVAAALASPADPTEGQVEVGGGRWFTLSWGNPADPPLLLVHGVTSDSGTFWRIGPAVAAAGRRVVAVDLPGHGRTGGWSGHHRFIETAIELVGFARAAGLDVAGLGVLGHSWGGMVVAHLPLAGLRPSVLVLLDPPTWSVAEAMQLPSEPTEQRYERLEDATAVVRRVHPDWSEGDVAAKAAGLTRFDEAAVRDVLGRNGDWDAGMAALRQPEAAGIERWLIRGEAATGGLIAEDVLPAIEAQLGPDHVITIAGGPHSPQRTHPEATVLAILRALG